MGLLLEVLFEILSQIAIEILIELGFERVLTSGGAATAAEGKTEIAELVRRATGRIQILPAGKIRPENVVELLRATGCDQVHASLRRGMPDPQMDHRTRLGEQMGSATRMDGTMVREMRSILDREAASG